MRDVICNTSPLQYLHQLGLIHLLPKLFGSVQTPPAVVAELAEGRRRGIDLPNLSELRWISVRPVQDRTLLPLVTRLGKGEKEVLALGLESPNHLLVLDDLVARRHADAANLNFTGTLGVLVLAKAQGLIDDVRQILRHLQELQFRVDSKTLRIIQDLAEELS